MKRAFTLTELLIIIAVIGALGAIIFPIGSSLLAKAHKTRCKSNLTQIGLALDLYTKDHNGVLPDLMSMRRNRAEDLPVLETVLSEYIGNPDFFKCPSDHEFFKKSGSSYAWNNVVSGMHRRGMEFFGAGEAAKIPLVGDKEAFHGDENGTNLLYGDFRTSDQVKFQVGGGVLGNARR